MDAHLAHHAFVVVVIGRRIIISAHDIRNPDAAAPVAAAVMSTAAPVLALDMVGVVPVLALPVLTLPSLAVLHGKTRRGGLVFDAADLVKDAVILPQAFLSAMRGEDEQQFRRQCIEALTRSEALDFIIDSLKHIATTTAQLLAQNPSQEPHA